MRDTNLSRRESARHSSHEEFKLEGLQDWKEGLAGLYQFPGFVLVKLYFSFLLIQSPKGGDRIFGPQCGVDVTFSLSHFLPSLLF